MPAAQELPYLGDRVILIRDLTPSEAHVLTAFLCSAGIQASAGDAHMVQMHSLLSVALGGAKVWVPQTQWQQAQALLQAFRQGDFGLGEDFDEGVSDLP